MKGLGSASLDNSRIGAYLSLLILLPTALIVHILLPAFRQSVLPYALNLDELSRSLGSWEGTDEAPLDDRKKEILQVDSSLNRLYVNQKGQKLSLYIAYWKRQSGDYQAAKHSPAVCLPSNGWKINEQNKVTVPFSTANSLTLKQLIAETSNHSYLFSYWFFAGETTFSDEWQALFRISLQNLIYGRSDGGIVELRMELDPLKSFEESKMEAQEATSDFVRALYPELSKSSHEVRTLR